jgi:cell division protein FtsZ
MNGATIKVVGLGGGGSNAVNRMIQVGIEGIEFIAANTDAQALARALAPVRVQLGPRCTGGLGAGGDPARGLAAAHESRAALEQALRGADLVFLAAGLGGGTGTGAIVVAAEAARQCGALVVAIVTMPFTFEGARRQRAAREALAGLRQAAHTLIVVPNDRLLQILPRSMPVEMAFQIADEALRQGVQGLAELITRPGLINLDFAHVRAIMQYSGGAVLAMGQGAGENKAVLAAQAALHHPLLDLGSVDQATGLLVYITGGEDLGLFEVHQAVETLKQAAHPQVEVLFGAAIDPQMNGRAELILVATGVGGTPIDVPARASAVPEPALRPPDYASAPRDDLDIPAYARRAQPALAGALGTGA